MIPPWIQRCFERCESCCLDNEDDRRRLGLAIADEMPVTPAQHNEAVLGLAAMSAEIVELRIALRMLLELDDGKGYRTAEQQAIIREVRRVLGGSS